jgi:glycosyltransferase involved in cell wall biosynthesis
MQVITPMVGELEDLRLLHEKLPEVSVDKLLLSIIVNNYNYSQFLHEAIDSALNQTYLNIEVIVVDDGSTDNSREIIASYENRIIPVLKENGGQASAFNAGFAVSRGEIVIFLDADDYLFPHTAEQVVAAWKPGVAKVQYRLQVIDALRTPLGFQPPCDQRLDSGEVWRILLKKGRYESPVTSGNGFSRAVLAQILPVPEAEFRISADGYLATLVPFYGQIVSIEQALGAYRLHGSNLWAVTNGLEVEKLGKSVQHDLQKYELITCKASELAYTVPKDLSLKDELHLRNRIVSLRLDPQNHPLPSDSLLGLVYSGVWAIWQYSVLDWKKRLLLSIWFIWVGLMPLPIAKLAIAWLYTPQSRPKTLNWLIQKNPFNKWLIR